MLHTLFHTQTKLPEKVIFLDLDDTIANPARDANGDFIVEADGHIDAVLLDKEKFAHFVQHAKELDVPLFIVTGRPDISRCVTLIHDLIASVNGFSDGIGGFHQDSIFYLSKMVEIDGKLVRKEIDTKVNIIQNIHREKYNYLPNENILFVEDLDIYLDPVKALGYQTIKADPKSLAHFAEAEKFMSALPINASVISRCVDLV